MDCPGSPLGFGEVVFHRVWRRRATARIVSASASASANTPTVVGEAVGTGELYGATDFVLDEYDLEGGKGNWQYKYATVA